MDMEYKLSSPESSSNMSGPGELPGGLQGFDDIDGESICRSTDFIVRHVLAPAVEATLFAFMKNCTLPSERIISDKWSLCTPEQDFNCQEVYDYTSLCKASRESHGYRTTAKPGTMDRLMEDSAGILLLVGLVLIGVLLGVASTIAVCLMCPKTHRWANSKLRNTPDSEKKARESVVSDYYTAIDDRHNNVTLQLRPVKPTHSASSANSDTCQRLNLSLPRDFDDPTYTDSDTHTTSLQDFDDQPGTSNGTGVSPTETYEPLSRKSPYKQSHNYAHIDTNSPCSPDSDHSYFVLEKKT